MQWATFLHIYQPPDQMADILDRIAHESYGPLFSGFLARPTLKFTLNINAGLTEQLMDHGYQDIVKTIATLISRGQCEVTETAKYHPFLPLTPAVEIQRQIQLNRETNQRFFGEAYQTTGFFPPEMAYDRSVVDSLQGLNFQWTIIDELAAPPDTNPWSGIPFIRGTKIRVVFRHRRISNLIMSGTVRTPETFLDTLAESREQPYLITAMDGETFGHHRPGHEQFLFHFLEAVQTVHIKELIQQFSIDKEIEPRASTWAASPEDIEQHRQFLSWHDPSNEIHQTQWEFTAWAIEYVKALDAHAPWFPATRHLLDQALHSCQYWWASAKPWWSLEMIEQGAYRLKSVILSNPNHSDEDAKRSQTYYERIVLTAMEWQRTGWIRRHEQQRQDRSRIPLKDQKDPVTFNGLIEFLRLQMRASAERQEFEQAILWRDAILKLENKLDIYDALHAIDLLRSRVPNYQIDAFLKQYRERYQKLRSGQPEQRD